MNTQHTLFIERFRPTELDNYLGSPELKAECQKWLANNDIPHLIFHGSAGLGKSTLARLLVKKLNCDYLIIKTSDENGIDTIREKVKLFASAASFNPIKIIIMEEAANLTNNAQEALKEIKILQGEVERRVIYSHPKFVEPMLEYIVNDFEKSRVMF
jgi:replication factor C small subunit